MQELERNLVRFVLEPTVALAMAGDIGRAILADRQGGRSPDVAALLIAQVDHLARRIGYRIVRPRRQLILLTVDRPGVAGTLDRDVEAEGRIGDDVDPGRRRRLPGVEDRHVFPSALGKTAEPIEEFERWSPQRNRWRRARQGGPRGRSRRRQGIGETFDLFGETATAAEEDDAGSGLQQAQRFRRGEVGTQDEDASARAARWRLRLRIACADQGLETGLQILDVGGRLLVQDHEIDGQLLHPPIFMSAQQLARDFEIVGVVDPQQDDRQVPRYALRP